MNNLPTIPMDQKTLDFSGVISIKYGARRYAAMVNGNYIRSKNGQIRWFKYEMEAGRVAYAEKLSAKPIKKLKPKK